MGTQLTERQGEGGVVLRVEVPGLQPDEIKVEVEDGVLTISGEHEEHSEEEKDSIVRRERSYGSFSRSMSVPAGVTAEAVEVSTEDGAIEVKIPLAGEAEG